MKPFHHLWLVALLFTPQVVLASDWKYGGMTKSGSDTEIVFYDSSSIVRTSTVTRFWVKSISMKRIESYADQKTRMAELIDAAAKKIVDGYTPAFLGLKSLRASSKSETEYKNRVATLVLWEVIANKQNIQMSSRLCFEINCTQQMIRIVEGHLFDDQGNIKPKRGQLSQDWGYIAPDTPSAWWSELICSPRLDE